MFINLIKESKIELNDNINLIYFDENQEKITILFEKKNYELIGWKMIDRFQDEIYFSLEIQSKNTKIDNNLFKIPSIN